MRKTPFLDHCQIAIAFMAAFFMAAAAFGQTTEFMYQASLAQNGNYANGNYDFQFTLFDAVTGGTQVGTTITKAGVTVSNGTFEVPLDFGAASFPGADRYMEMQVAVAGSGQYTTLTPRLKVESTPYSVRALNAAHADSASGVTEAFATTSTSSTATFTATDSAAGVSNPDLNNLPPAAVLGQETSSGSTSETTAGVIGTSAAEGGFGILGIATGTPSGLNGGNTHATGVSALATSSTGQTFGLQAQVNSPDGIAVFAQVNGAGALFDGNNGSADVFTVTGSGNVFANRFTLFNSTFAVGSGGGMRARSFSNSQPIDNLGNFSDPTFFASAQGDVSANSLTAVGGVSANNFQIPDPANANVPHFNVQPDGTVSGHAFYLNGSPTLGLGSNGAFSATGISLLGGQNGNTATLSLQSDGSIIQSPGGPTVTFSVNGGGAVSADSFSLRNGNGSFSNQGNLTAENATIIADLTVQNITAQGNVGIQGNLDVTGTKHAIVRVANGRWVGMAAVESPENWFEDFGERKLQNGRAWVPIDETFAETTNSEPDYHVFLTPEGNCRGLYVAKKTSKGFEVHELGNGRSNTRFDYRIVSKRRGYEKERFAEPSTVVQQGAGEPRGNY